MTLHNLKKAPNYKVEKWLKDSIPNLTPYQQDVIYQNEIVRFAPFEFYEERPKVKSIWWRLTIVLVPLAYISLAVGLPFAFIITGRWGYDDRYMEWLRTWFNKIGL